MPASPAGSLRQQVMQQYAYLFQMAQQLNLALEQLEQAESGTVRAAGAASGGGAAVQSWRRQTGSTRSCGA